MEVKIEKVVFKSPQKNNTLTYLFTTEITGIIQVKSSKRFSDGSEKANVISLQKLPSVEMIVEDLLETYKEIEMEVESWNTIDEYELNSNVDKLKIKKLKDGNNEKIIKKN